MLTRSSDPTPADELAGLAAEVRRLRPDGRNPEPFYEARSEIAGALMRLSRRLSLRHDKSQRREVLYRLDTSPPRAMPIAVPKPPQVIAAPPRPLPPRPRRIPLRRHRYPRPPTLPADVQPRFI